MRDRLPQSSQGVRGEGGGGECYNRPLLSVSLYCSVNYPHHPRGKGQIWRGGERSVCRTFLGALDLPGT